MPVKNFKFVSPGVFIQEIDNSFTPRQLPGTGPIVIGRASKGVAMQPVTVQSYADFVTMFGDTVPGNGGGDIYRDGNMQSPMYGLYAAKAHLAAGTTPLTYIRLLGASNVNSVPSGEAGWQTQQNVSTQGGAYGLFVFQSGSGTDLGEGHLAAVWYLDASSSIELSGTVIGGASSDKGVGKAILSDTNGAFVVELSSSVKGVAKTSFSFDDESSNFVRKAFNTNPQKVNAGELSYPASLQESYWLGESFEQDLRNSDLVSGELVGTILPIAFNTAATNSPAHMRSDFKNAAAGWFIGQDVSGVTGSFVASEQQKLFKLIGLNQGEWLHKNVKVTIANVRPSTSLTSDYGTFSVVLRDINDTDNNQTIVERFDNLTLDPTSPNYIAAVIGDQYYLWSEGERLLKLYGDYPNKSKFVRVLMNDDVDNGATEPSLLPFGYFGPPKFSDVTVTGSGDLADTYIYNTANVLSGAAGELTGTLVFPRDLLRVSASDAGLTNSDDVSFGFLTTRSHTSTRNDYSTFDSHRMWTIGMSGEDEPSGPGIDAYSYVFTMNDVVANSTSYYYQEGSRASGDAVADYTDLLKEGYDSFTAPFWGGFDGLNITVPDPFYNNGMGNSATVNDNYAYNTLRRAIDSVADPEFINTDLIVVPGLTNLSLTQHLVNVCEARADAMTLIDLPDAYIPVHEQYKATKDQRVSQQSAQTISDLLRSRRIDSSYGATFFPWVQTRDEVTGQLLWIPPSTAILGVLASSAAKSEIWFAPAGFNRGGLSDGAAGIPVTSISRRLTSKERDILYMANINPIASFPNSGIVLFGQKTLQERPSALDRINVRRLVLFLKKQISILSTQIIFEQNVRDTWSRFEALIEPLLANTLSRFGISEYRLILDESTNTPDVVDQNAVYAKIMVKPVKAIEFIAIDFIIASSGASFDD